MQINLFRRQYWKGQRLLLLAFLVLHTIASYYYIAHQNVSFDEPDYIEYAKRWLHGKPERVNLLDDSKSPVVAICWIPRMVRQTINPGYKLNDYGRKDQAEGRYMMILFSWLAALYVYKWCRALYGVKGWGLPLLLLLFDPLYLAYSTLITTDLVCGSFLVALLYHYRKYLLYKSSKQLCLVALYTGLGIVTKQTMLFVIILLPILSLIHVLFKSSSHPVFSKKSVKDVLAFTLIVLLIINVAYYFHGSFIPFGNYVFQSNTLQLLQDRLAIFHWLPIPLPEPYVQSLDMIKAHAEYGAGGPESTYNGVYLFGELNLHKGYWYYYVVLLFYKMPIGVMLLFLACVPLLLRRFNRSSFVEKYMYLLLPALFFWVVLSFFNQFQTGVRHILLIFPIMYIGLGKLFVEIKRKKLYQYVTAGLIAYTFISIATYYPYLIPYTNEFITDKKTVYRKILDSSIDYGQSDSSVAVYVATHPGFKLPTAKPDTGKFAITMSNVVNHYSRDKNPYNWLQKFEPKGLYKYTILLYNINREELNKAGLK